MNFIGTVCIMNKKRNGLFKFLEVNFAILILIKLLNNWLPLVAIPAIRLGNKRFVVINDGHWLIVMIYQGCACSFWTFQLGDLFGYWTALCTSWGAWVLLEDWKRSLLVETTGEHFFIFFYIDFAVFVLVKHVEKILNGLICHQFLMIYSSDEEFLEINFAVLICINCLQHLFPFITKTINI